MTWYDSGCKPHQKREKGGVLALDLDCHCFIGIHNNQPIVGAWVRMDIGCETNWAGSVWEDALLSFGSSNCWMQKNGN